MRLPVFSSKQWCCDHDRELSFRVLGTFQDVRQKAKRLRDNGSVSEYVIEKNGAVITAQVRGDNGTYEVKLYRTTYPMRKLLFWSCTCPWGQWAFKRQHTYIGRNCSHALAVLFEAYGNDYRKVRRNDPSGFASETGE